MLYHVAMTELSRRGQNKEFARCHATEAQKIAQEFDWRTELPNICLLLEDIENVFTVQCDDTDKDVKAVTDGDPWSAKQHQATDERAPVQTN